MERRYTKRRLWGTFLPAMVLGCCCNTPLDATVLVTDASFETPALAPGTFQYAPTGSPWTFTPAAALVNPGTPLPAGENFADYTAPDGVQYVALQGAGAVSQLITFPTSQSYDLSFDIAGRGLSPGNYDGNQSVEVLIDGTGVYDVTTSSGQPFAPVLAQFSVSAGAHVLQFAGLDGPPQAGDHTAYIDNVAISPAPEAPTLESILAVVIAALLLRRPTNLHGKNST